MTFEHQGLAVRAVHAARAARDADRDRFPVRYQDWHSWELRARRGRALATALGVPVEQVAVIDDPQRVYGAVPGDLLIVTDPGEREQACHANCVSHGYAKISRRDLHSAGKGTIRESGHRH